MNLIKPQVLIFILIISLFTLIFSYKILEIPGGLAADEASFGLNGVLLSETGRDQNNRFLPVFVLSTEKNDWRQPITQYYLAGFFKLFGSSVFNLRFSSVVLLMISAGLVYLTTKQLTNPIVAFMAMLVFLTTPLITIQSHLGFDNIMPIPFTLLWLYSLLKFQKSTKLKYLVIAGISLGIGFYSYKAMRAIVPIWSLMTIIYLVIESRKFPKQQIFSFLLGLAPFILITPILNLYYPGSIFAGQNPTIESLDGFFYPYLSSFDLSFLYIKGDEIDIHSTKKHGMLLLGSAPLFFLGLYQSIRQRNFQLFLVVCFFSAPILFGTINSVHRASRLMALIPLYCLIAAVGFKSLLDLHSPLKTTLIILSSIFIIFNYLVFINYYWATYPGLISSTNTINLYKDYQSLSSRAKAQNLQPIISTDINDHDQGLFYEAIYFDQPIKRLDPTKVDLPKNSVILSHRQNIPELKGKSLPLNFYHLHFSE